MCGGVTLSLLAFASGAGTPTVQVDAATPTCNGKNATIVGTNGNDVLKGTSKADVIVGLGGNDVIYGYGGNDTICAGSGADKVYGGDGNDWISGGRGPDRLWGGPGSDTILGGDGADLIDGDRGSDLARGGPGVDTCLRTADANMSCEPTWLSWDAGLSIVDQKRQCAYNPSTQERSDVNGRTYHRNVVIEGWDNFLCDWRSAYSQIEYNLGRKYRRFTATIGLRDDTPTNRSVRFDVYGDGPTPLKSKTVKFGESFPIKVDVTNVLRLKLRVTYVSGDAWDTYSVWASPLVSANTGLMPEKPIP
jgi:hypothetical protein